MKTSAAQRRIAPPRPIPFLFLPCVFTILSLIFDLIPLRVPCGHLLSLIRANSCQFVANKALSRTNRRAPAAPSRRALDTLSAHLGALSARFCIRTFTDKTEQKPHFHPKNKESRYFSPSPLPVPQGQFYSPLSTLYSPLSTLHSLLLCLYFFQHLSALFLNGCILPADCVTICGSICIVI